MTSDLTLWLTSRQQLEIFKLSLLFLSLDADCKILNTPQCVSSQARAGAVKLFLFANSLF